MVAEFKEMENNWKIEEIRRENTISTHLKIKSGF